MVPLAFTLPAGEFDAVVVTSANALRALGDEGQPLRALPLYAVGSRTADMARAAGFSSVQHAEGGAAALARLIAPLKLKSILYLAGRDRTADLAALVAPVAVTLVEVYDMAAATPALPEARGVMLYSRRAAERFLDLTTPVTRAKMAALCLSANIADALQNAHLRAIHVAEAPNEPAMMGLAMRVCRDQKGSWKRP